MLPDTICEAATDEMKYELITRQKRRMMVVKCFAVLAFPSEYSEH
jgi:hypothetical protein